MSLGNRRIRMLFGALVWLGLTTAIVAGWKNFSAVVASRGAMFPGAVVAIGLGLLAGAAGWSVLQARHLRAQSIGAFIAAQPAKYLPVGGFAQAAGQVALTSPLRTERSAVALALVLHSGVQVLAASIVAALLWLGPAPNRLATSVTGGFAVAGLLLLRQSIVLQIVFLTRSMFGRLNSPTHIPSTLDLWRSCGLSVLTLLLSGGALAALLGLWGSPSEFLGAVGAFSAAWGAGFLVLIVPSGIGVRELVLFALIPDVPGLDIVGMSLFHRFATLAAELILLAIVTRRAFVRSGRSD